MTESRRPRVYLAGPTVFLPDAMAVAEAKKALCAKYGFEGVFPLDGGVKLDGLSPFDQGMAIYRANCALMDGCDAVIADMTPFRGPSLDAGTAFEIGYMTAQGKRVYGYSNVREAFTERTKRYYEMRRQSNEYAESTLPDEEDMRPPECVSDYTLGTVIEDFDMPDNLMMVGAIVDSQGRFRSDTPLEEGREMRCLATFHACLLWMRRDLDPEPVSDAKRTLEAAFAR